MLLISGVGTGALAVALLFYVLAPARVAAEKRSSDDGGPPMLASTSQFLVARTDKYLGTRTWAPFPAHELELAGIAATAGSLVVTSISIAAAVAILVTVLTGSLFLGLLLAALVPVVAKLLVRVRMERRRKAFGDQLDETLQIIASALRAGHSFVRALDAVAQEAESPTSEEFVRIINEHRIGRDLIIALEQTAQRMDSEDFRWVAEAVAVHRDTGGNLNEVIDRVGTTMRERRQMREQVDSLAAEGKFSAIVLMALPPVGAGLFTLVNPGYVDPLVTEPFGQLMLVLSLILYIVGGIWIRAVVNVKY